LRYAPGVTSRSFKNQVREAIAQLLRLVPGSRALALKRDLRDAAWLAQADAVIVSYPKSGRTFVRAMLAHLFELRYGVDERQLLEFRFLRKAPREVPRLLFTHAGDTMRPAAKNRIDRSAYRHVKTVLIARHPGDIAVSRYHHLKNRSRDRGRRRLAKLPLGEFIWSDKGGIRSIVKFLNDFAALPGITIVRYEDFLERPADTLKRVADAIGLKARDDEIAAAVEFASLERLRQKEREGYFNSARLKAARKGNDKSFKVRKGASGGYRDALGEACVEKIDNYVAEHLDPALGYTSKRRPRNSASTSNRAASRVPNPFLSWRMSLAIPPSCPFLSLRHSDRRTA
jgi:hypothetical protein